MCWAQSNHFFSKASNAGASSKVLLDQQNTLGDLKKLPIVTFTGFSGTVIFDLFWNLILFQGRQGLCVKKCTNQSSTFYEFFNKRDWKKIESKYPSVWKDDLIDMLLLRKVIKNSLCQNRKVKTTSTFRLPLDYCNSFNLSDFS